MFFRIIIVIAWYLYGMADVHDKATRSYNMSRIKSKHTQPEMLVRSFLHKNGFRFRLHNKSLPGCPDLLLKKYDTAIFIHGCFWHGHNDCKYYVIPKTRTDWWLNKITINKKNDTKAVRALRKQGWKIVIVWECALKPKKIKQTCKKLLLTMQH